MPPTVTSRKLSGAWVDGTVSGLRFQAKVFDEGSEYGINGGRVSKLMVWDESTRQAQQNIFAGAIVNYDRSWDIEPANEHDKEILKAVLEHLENLPATEA